MYGIRTITLDLDDTLWEIGPVIRRAERRLRAWLNEHYPRIAELHQPEDIVELRAEVVAEFQDRSHDLTFVRRTVLSRMGIAAGYGDAFVDDAFDFGRVAGLPERTITVASSGEPPVEEVVPEASDAPEIEGVPAEPPPQSAFWQLVAEILAAVWLLTLVGWWWTTRPRRHREPREPAPPPIHKQQSRCLKEARKAALEGDGQGVRTALLEWGRLQWPDDAPRSVGELAQRVSAPLSDELRNLCSAAYGPHGGKWDGEVLARSLRSFAVLDDPSQAKYDDPLPPLMPGA